MKAPLIDKKIPSVFISCFQNKSSIGNFILEPTQFIINLILLTRNRDISNTCQVAVAFHQYHAEGRRELKLFSVSVVLYEKASPLALGFDAPCVSRRQLSPA